MKPAAPHVFLRGGRCLGLLVLGPLLLGGCRVDALVTISVQGPGGEVTARFEADEEAVSMVGGPGIVAQGAQVADLRQAGWEVAGPRRTAGGGAVVTASKRFSRPAELGAVVDELSGPEGPLQGFRLDRDRGLTRVRHRLSGGMYLGEAPGELLTGFGNDPGLARRLEAAGVDAQRVAELLTQRAVEGFRLALVVDLPGREPVRFEAGPGKRVEVRVAATQPDRARPALLVLAGGLAVAALALLAPRRRSWRS
ncbi:MAG: hypothetical protein ACRD0C_17640 [Acidimicrobiia bacterium]